MNNTHAIIVGFAMALAPLATLQAADTLRPANKPTADRNTDGKASAPRVLVGGEVGKATTESLETSACCHGCGMKWQSCGVGGYSGAITAAARTGNGSKAC